jgi:hypothetical protein
VPGQINPKFSGGDDLLGAALRLRRMSQRASNSSIPKGLVR